MILVDTAVWIDHLHRSEARLVELLNLDEVGCHDFVIAELALGSLANRAVILDLLDNLHRFPRVEHDEVMHLVDRGRLWGRGLSAVDVHLMASVAVSEGARLWTRDKRLNAACAAVSISTLED